MTAEIQTEGGVTLCTSTKVTIRRSQRAAQELNVWHGTFLSEHCQRPPQPGETLILHVAEGQRLTAVVMSVKDDEVHFRTRDAGEG